MRKVRVRVPATTANLGTGFDFLGLALDMYNTIELEAKKSKKEEIFIEETQKHEDTLPKDNIVYKAIKKILNGSYNIHIKLENKIPIARGLGSSAACRIGGLFTAYKICYGTNPDDEAKKYILDVAARLEGHPDNAAAALYGGIVVTAKEENRIITKRMEVRPGLLAVICVPDFEVSTEEAREKLPPSTKPLYSREEYVNYAMSATALSFGIAQGDYKGFSKFTEDKGTGIHQPHRKGLVPGMEKVFKAAKKAGALGAFLSGSGSTIIALTDNKKKAGRIGKAMKKEFNKHKHNGKDINSYSDVIDVVNKGAVIVK